jgi:hypothetical protein
MKLSSRNIGAQHIPPDVSPVFYNLYEYIRNHKVFGGYKEAELYALFSVAYTLYCDEKKQRIHDNIEAILVESKDSKDKIFLSNHPVIKYLFRSMDNPEDFEKLCIMAEDILAAYMSQDVRSLVLEAAREVRPKFWEHFFSHGLFAVLTVIVLGFAPLLGAMLGENGPVVAVHEFGEYLVSHFPLPSPPPPQSHK